MTTPTLRSGSRAPERMCVGCRERATKSELLRVTRGFDKDGQAVVTPDPRATAQGRGAYLHRSVACLQQAERRRAFGRALRYGGGVLTAGLRAYLEELDMRQEPASAKADET